MSSFQFPSTSMYYFQTTFKKKVYIHFQKYKVNITLSFYSNFSFRNLQEDNTLPSLGIRKPQRYYARVGNMKLLPTLFFAFALLYSVESKLYVGKQSVLNARNIRSENTHSNVYSSVVDLIKGFADLIYKKGTRG